MSLPKGRISCGPSYNEDGGTGGSVSAAEHVPPAAYGVTL